MTWTCKPYYDHRLKPTHYVSVVSGIEYPIDEYCNWGHGGVERGKKDLPKFEYPYKFKYLCTRCKNIIVP
jgi:hypothetical protein